MEKIKMKLVGEDGNAFAIIGRFTHAARRAGWPKHEIDAVVAEAQSGDYDNLLQVFMKHTEE